MNNKFRQNNIRNSFHDEIKIENELGDKPLLDKNRLIDFFLEIVQIDSISREERLLADRIIQELTKLGFRVKEDGTAVKINGNTGNLIIDFPGDDGQDTFLLSAHLDRVEPGRGIIPEIKGEYIYSKGDTVLAGDDLIGVAAIIEAVRVIKENNLRHRPFKIIFTVAEEVGLLGAKNLDSTELEDLDYGLVFDTDGDVGLIVNQAPTQLKFNANISGKAAHAGMNPAKGINAIKIASLAISNMKLGQIDEETTANIGVIKGGRASNIVPDMVELEGEIRSHSEERLKKQKEGMVEVIDRVCKQLKGEVSYDIERLYSNFAISKESDIINFIDNINTWLGIETFLTKSGGGSDANVFNKLGLATLNLGVGMENVHSTAERVKLKNLELLVKQILGILTTKDII